MTLFEQEIRDFEQKGNNWLELYAEFKTLEFSAKIGWRALAEGEPTKTFPNWRREWDSNPR